MILQKLCWGIQGQGTTSSIFISAGLSLVVPDLFQLPLQVHLLLHPLQSSALGS